MSDLRKAAEKYAEIEIFGDRESTAFEECVRDFIAGAEYQREQMLKEASNSFNEWINEVVRFEMGYSSRKNTMTIEAQLMSEYVWQASRLLVLKEIEDLKNQIKELKDKNE